MADETLNDAIANAATAPAEISIDGQTVREQPLSEQIKTDKYTRANAALKNGLPGFVFGKMRPHGGAY